MFVIVFCVKLVLRYSIFSSDLNPVVLYFNYIHIYVNILIIDIYICDMFIVAQLMYCIKL